MVGLGISEPSTVLLGGGFNYFLFSPLFGEDSGFDSYFSKGLKPQTSIIVVFLQEQDSWDSWMYPYQRTPMGNPYIGPI